MSGSKLSYIVVNLLLTKFDRSSCRLQYILYGDTKNQFFLYTPVQFLWEYGKIVVTKTMEKWYNKYLDLSHKDETFTDRLVTLIGRSSIYYIFFSGKLPLSSWEDMLS